VERQQDAPVLADGVGDPLGQAEDGPAHPIGPQDRPFRIAQQRERQVQALPEAIVRLLRIAGDPDHVAVDPLQVRELPAKLAGLSRSAGGECLREEEENDRALAQHLVERTVSHPEVGSGLAALEHGEETIHPATVHCPQSGGPSARLAAAQPPREGFGVGEVDGNKVGPADGFLQEIGIEGAPGVGARASRFRPQDAEGDT